MKKVLSVSSVSRQFYLFEQGNFEVLHSLGYEIHAAANYEDYNERLEALDMIRKPFDVQRSPFSLKNIKAYKQLKKMIDDGNYDIVHCHSPIGGVLARLAARKARKRGTKVIYTAHGFHFFKGAPLINWLVYYSVERICARFTDCIITINKEDYERAKGFKAKSVEYVPGVGVDVKKIRDCEEKRTEIQKEFNISSTDIVISSVGELINRKDHETVIKALARLGNKRIKYIICGRGELEEYLRSRCRELGVEDQVIFAGFRKDVCSVLKSSEIFVFPSLQEGLPVSLMEAMAVGLPVICTRIRGNTDLIEEGKCGFFVDPKDDKGFAEEIKKLAEDKSLRERMGAFNKERITAFSSDVVKSKMREIYLNITK